MNEGQWTPEEHEQVLRNAAQGVNARQWDREAREEAERANIAYMRQMEEWKASVKAAGFKESRSIPTFLKVHLPKAFLLCEFFQKSMQIFVDMIQHLKLHLHSRHFQIKPLQHQAKALHLHSIEEMSLHGLVQDGSSQHHPQSFQDLLQSLQHIHLVHHLQPFLNLFKNRRIQ